MLKCYVISSPSRNISELESKFRAAGLELVVIPAVWGPLLPPESIESRVDIEGTKALIGWRQASLNEIGCALSHQEVYFRAINSGCDWALVLEDDVSLSTDFFLAIKNLNLDFTEPTIVSFFSRGKRFVTVNSGFRIGNSSLFSCPVPPGQTAAYIINREALELTLTFEKVAGWADWPRWAFGCNFYLAYPWLVSEDANDSLIPAQPLNRFSYWIWRIGVVSGFGYLKNKRHFKNYSEYSFWHLTTWVLRIKYKLGFIIPMNTGTDGPPWISRLKS